MTPEQLLDKICTRSHVAVVGSKEQLDEMATKYGWSYLLTPLCGQEDTIIAAVDINKREIFCLLGVIWQLENIRETLINYSRYGKVLPLSSHKLEELFMPEYESLHEGKNARVQAENISHYCDMLDYGFGFSKELLQDMLSFCEHNELYVQAARIKEELDEANA